MADAEDKHPIVPRVPRGGKKRESAKKYGHGYSRTMTEEAWHASCVEQLYQDALWDVIREGTSSAGMSSGTGAQHAAQARVQQNGRLPSMPGENSRSRRPGVAHAQQMQSSPLSRATASASGSSDFGYQYGGFSPSQRADAHFPVPKSNTRVYHSILMSMTKRRERAARKAQLFRSHSEPCHPSSRVCGSDAPVIDTNFPREISGDRASAQQDGAASSKSSLHQSRASRLFMSSANHAMELALSVNGGQVPFLRSKSTGTFKQDADALARFAESANDEEMEDFLEEMVDGSGAFSNSNVVRSQSKRRLSLAKVASALAPAERESGMGQSGQYGAADELYDSFADLGSNFVSKSVSAWHLSDSEFPEHSPRRALAAESVFRVDENLQRQWQDAERQHNARYSWLALSPPPPQSALEGDDSSMARARSNLANIPSSVSEGGGEHRRIALKPQIVTVVDGDLIVLDLSAVNRDSKESAPQESSA
ncbi:hypothetical protein FVE85_4492 [Porphyridium purpureum]|uniref:Uncharacterized protein n=1 Tax=Porphyridium purpureum TaxID=35688 RepID=A0A5J4YIV2_PORPP|nr:hypothetical protein FVE85_4492 [Porphyridium purpureum]|eukprot:POR9819..scf297_16